MWRADKVLADLTGRSALVVGAGPGLGGAIAEQLAQAGADLFLVARNAENLEAAVQRVEAAGRRAYPIIADLEAPADHGRILSAIEEQGGSLDILVHNAARHGEQKPIADASIDDFRQTMDVNLFRPLELTQRLLPVIERAQSGNVIFVGAMAMRMVASVGRAGYAISKAAINQAVRSLAYELGAKGIRVNAVVPGWMDSAIVQSWREDEKLAPFVDRALASIPLGRIPLPEHVAGTVVYLASDLSAAVTGACVDANGGHFMSA